MFTLLVKLRVHNVNMHFHQRDANIHHVSIHHDYAKFRQRRSRNCQVRKLVYFQRNEIGKIEIFSERRNKWCAIYSLDSVERTALREVLHIRYREHAPSSSACSRCADQQGNYSQFPNGTCDTVIGISD